MNLEIMPSPKSNAEGVLFFRSQREISKSVDWQNAPVSRLYFTDKGGLENGQKRQKKTLENGYIATLYAWKNKDGDDENGCNLLN